MHKLGSAPHKRRYLKFIALQDALKVIVLHSWGFIGLTKCRHKGHWNRWLPAWETATAGKGKGTEPSNENVAAIVMAIEMKVAARWPVVLLSGWAIWPVGLLVTSSKFACNRNGSGNSLCVLCVWLWCVWCVLKAAANFTSSHINKHTHVHTHKRRAGIELWMSIYNAQN